MSKFVNFGTVTGFKVFTFRGGVSCTDFNDFKLAVEYAIRKTKEQHTNWVEILGVTEHSGFLVLWKWEDK